MQLMIRQRRFTLTEAFHVYDSQGEIRYDVKDEFLSWGHHFHVYDHATGREVGSIHQKLLTFRPQFEIQVEGRYMGVVRKEFSLFGPRYHVDYLDWEVDGNFLGWDYEATSGDRQILTISKAVLSWTDTYTLNIADPADELPALMLVLAIDAANCSDDQ